MKEVCNVAELLKYGSALRRYISLPAPRNPKRLGAKERKQKYEFTACASAPRDHLVLPRFMCPELKIQDLNLILQWVEL